MSSGNCQTEFTRLERAAETAILRDQALVQNAVLRRALAVLAHEHVLELAVRRPGLLADAEAGTAVLICAVMKAHEEFEKEAGHVGAECNVAANPPRV